MKEIVAEPRLVAYCGLYCGACKRYLSGKCPGCAHNEKATWCTVRSCCIEHEYSSCADCKIEASLDECKDYNNFMAKLFGFVFRSDRAACIQLISEQGLEEYAKYMTERRIMTIKR